jgi:hypothetical protein
MDREEPSGETAGQSVRDVPRGHGHINCAPHKPGMITPWPLHGCQARVVFLRLPTARCGRWCRGGVYPARMAHGVELGIASRVPIGNVDVSLKVKKDGRLLGTLHISRDGADHIPSHGRQHFELTWTQLHEALKANRTPKPKH